MNVDTQQLIKLAAGAEMPDGFQELPEVLQGDARRLLVWAEKQREMKAAHDRYAAERKKRNKQARRSRKINRRRR